MNNKTFDELSDEAEKLAQYYVVLDADKKQVRRIKDSVKALKDQLDGITSQRSTSVSTSQQ